MEGRYAGRGAVKSSPWSAGWGINCHNCQGSKHRASLPALLAHLTTQPPDQALPREPAQALDKHGVAAACCRAASLPPAQRQAGAVCCGGRKACKEAKPVVSGVQVPGSSRGCARPARAAQTHLTTSHQMKPQER